MPILEKLQPQAVFAHFEQLCAIPHGSGNTKAISDYLVRFAAARGLRHIQDAHNNVIIFCPGTPGYEAAAPVIATKNATIGSPIPAASPRFPPQSSKIMPNRIETCIPDTATA